MWSEKIWCIKEKLIPFVPEPIVRRRHQYLLGQLAAKKGLRFVERDLFFDLIRGNTILRIRSAHLLHLPHMIENFDYYVDSVVPACMDGINLVDMSGPRYHRLKGFGDIPFLFPSLTEPYCTTAEYLDFGGLQGGEFVLDIGAYAGVTSIIFAQLVGPTGHVYAFEADKLNYECAQVNIEMAGRVLGLHNITLLHQAVWSNSNGLLFSSEGSMSSGPVAVFGRNRGLERWVPSITLQDFFAERRLSHADFVKVDIEGSEVEMLEASAGFLKNMGARLIVEPHVVNGKSNVDRCCRLLRSAGYDIRARDRVGELQALIEAMPVMAGRAAVLRAY